MKELVVFATMIVLFAASTIVEVSSGTRRSGISELSATPVVDQVASFVTDIPNEMVLIKGGEIRSIEIDEDMHSFKVGPFLLDKYEVTIADFKKFLEESGYVPSSEREGAVTYVFNGSGFDKGVMGVKWNCDETGLPCLEKDYKSYPVVHVSAEDAMEYARWVGKRLPSVCEWVFAAAGDISRRELRSYVRENGWYNLTVSGDHNLMKVGLKSPNHFGVYDLIGNAAEIVSPVPDVFTNRWGYSFGSSSFDDFGSLFEFHLSMNRKGSTFAFNGFRCAKDI
jgi:formylglycine-generating enzyme required for sulfatase activity